MVLEARRILEQQRLRALEKKIFTSSSTMATEPSNGSLKRGQLENQIGVMELFTETMVTCTLQVSFEDLPHLEQIP